MAYLQTSRHLFCCLPIQDAISYSGKSSGALLHLPYRKMSGVASSFARGSPAFCWRTFQQRRRICSVSIRCGQSKKSSNGFFIWVGRLSMVGFVGVLSVEVITGKGLLENFGLVTPLPTVALVITALVGVLTAVFIFQSASRS